jgi:hypothetical protein
VASLTVPRHPTLLDCTFGSAAALFLVSWAGAILLELPRGAALALGVPGFVERRRTSIGTRLGVGGLLVTVGMAAIALVGLPAAVLGPPLVAAGVPAGTLLRVGGALQLVALTLTLAITPVRAIQRPAGSGGLLAGVVFGLARVALGAAFAQLAAVAELVAVHSRLALFGFLALTLVGATRYALRQAGRPLGLVVTAAVSVGILLELGAGRLGIPVAAGRAVVVLAVVYAVDAGWALFAPAINN